MISIEKCRELLGSAENYTDREIENIRDRLYELGEFALNSYFEELKNKPK